ncbi:MAG TPA: hypothetical protein VL326_17995, partial [Kofleriaceae bacterium]|nr:hypothetical protein [Kofleriaceae bacterium]
MNAIVGRVVIKETGVAIPGLTVVAFGSGAHALAATPSAAASSGTRLGSVITDETGSFRIEYDAALTSPSVRVAVFADANATDPAHALYADTSPRTAAAPVESYMIRIAQQELVEQTVPLPVDPNDAAVRVGAQYALRLQLGAQINDVASSAGRAVIDPQRAALSDFADRVRTSMRTRGRAFPPDPSGSVQSRVRDAMASGLAKRFAPTARRARVALSEAERAQLPQDVPTESAEALIFGDGDVGERLHNSLLATACRDARMPDTKCGDASGNGSSGNGTGTPPPKPTIEDTVWRALATSPGLGGTRPVADDVARRVAGLQLASGPADVTALHDFSVLQLALDNVWQDVLDERVV